MVQGPPIRDIVTSFDAPLRCLKGKIPARLNFGVGSIADTTGKEQFSDGGTGKLVTQGAGDIVQSALFTAGVGVVNRRDPNIPLAENNWGIRNIKTQAPVDFFVSGSVNSLDFIPGGSVEIGIAGVGPRARQNRIVVGLDLALTDAATGRVVANVPIQKQLFESETGFSMGRYFGTTLTEVEAGGMRREALQATLRQMLTYASFELLAQLLEVETAAPCRGLVAMDDALAGEAPPYAEGALSAALQSHDAYLETAAAPAAAGPAQAATADMSPAVVAKPNPPEALKLAAEVTVLASRSIAAAEAAAEASTPAEKKKAVDEAGLNLVLAVKRLQAAAAAGLNGPEGDAAALLVEQAMRLEQTARESLEAATAQPAPPTGVSGPNDPKLGSAGEPVP